MSESMRGGDSREGAPRRAGFTLIEVIVAVVILAIGVLGLAGTTGYLVRQVNLGDLMTERSAAFQTVIDRLQSLPYDSVDTGADSVGVFYVTWTSVPQGAQSKMVTIVTLGPGMSGSPPMSNPQVVDSFDFRILRR